MGRFARRTVNEHRVSFKTYGYPRLLLNLEIEHADGTRQWVVSDGDWKVTADGPTRTNNEYDGEEYDARKKEHRMTYSSACAPRGEGCDLISIPLPQGKGGPQGGG